MIQNKGELPLALIARQLIVTRMLLIFIWRYFLKTMCKLMVFSLLHKKETVAIAQYLFTYRFKDLDFAFKGHTTRLTQVDLLS